MVQGVGPCTSSQCRSIATTNTPTPGFTIKHTISREMNLPPISKQWTGRNPAENHLSGKTLRGEIRTGHRPHALGLINQNCAETLNQYEKLTTIGSPNQQLIDKILARCRYEWFVKKEEHHAQNRKLEELKESLKKELYELHLQKKHLKTEFMIPSHTHDNQNALQARIIQIRNKLPAMEDRIKELRLHMSCPVKLLKRSTK
ncbi:uncharacterized protein [Mobula birostris]|uniref:uncharacterized protein isoform X1 n=1 Tax=Mobula birostris TaxID=1983395 RepID=UPI003B2854DC